MFNRSRLYLSRWFTVSMGSILIVFASVVYYLRAEDSLEALDRLLYKKARVMASSVEYEVSQEQLQTLDLSHVPLLGNSAKPLDTEIVYARWYDAEAQLVRFWGSPPTESLSTQSGFHTIQLMASPSSSSQSIWLRQVTLPVEEKNVVVGYLQIALPLANTQTNLEQFRLVLTLAIPVALGSISLAGWLLSRVAMQPIRQSYFQLQRFTADASHELRTPIAAILNNAQVGLLTTSKVEQQANSPSVRQLRSRLADVVEVAQSMSTLVNNLLFLARHEGRLAPDQLRIFDVGELLQELVDDYAAESATKEVKVYGEIPEQVVMIQAEPDLLRQAIANLLSNACKYTPAGGEVKARLLLHAHWVIVQIEDSGIGIPVTDLPHIFDRFYRVDTQRARASGGFGLGLAIVHQIVTAHSGCIKVKSELGQGTLFQIELPQKQPEF